MMLPERFQVTAADLLGQGGESQVYALGADRVLRIYKPGISPAYIERRRAFYAQLQARRPPFETPQLLETGVADGRVYAVERRMRGRDFSHVLPTLEGAARERALASYLDVAGQIGAIAFPELPFGELLRADELIQRPTWPGYLRERVQRTLALSRPDLEQDVPGLDAVIADFDRRLAALEGFAAKQLVHGDYFPGNVFIDDDLTICGVGDFGYTTLVGDGRMDLAGAVVFLEVLPGHRPEDTALLTRLAAERRGPEILPFIQLYRRYYALYFSVCKGADDVTYAWCVRELSS